MTSKEKIIRRLNKGFGFNIPLDAEIKTHQANSQWSKANGAQAWFISDMRVPFELNLGCCDTMTECLKWKRWIINMDPCEREIFEYFEENSDYFKQPHYHFSEYKYLIEKDE